MYVCIYIYHTYLLRHYTRQNNRYFDPTLFRVKDHLALFSARLQHRFSLDRLYVVLSLYGLCQYLGRGSGRERKRKTTEREKNFEL